MIPPAESGSGCYQTVFAFDSAAHLHAWTESRERKAWLDRIVKVTYGDNAMRVLTGMEGWFVLPGQDTRLPPARHKMAMVTWLGIFPLTLVLSALVGPVLSLIHPFLSIAAVTALVITAMTWIVMPGLVRWFARWLLSRRDGDRFGGAPSAFSEFLRGPYMNQLNGYDFEDLKVGMSATFAKTITEADIVLFAAVSGDNNAVHINEEFAKTTPFKGRIAHGILSARVISAAIAGQLPGPGTVYLAQNLRFKAPVKPGDTVAATVTVKELFAEKRRVALETICTVGGNVVIEGDALVMPTRRAKRNKSPA